MLAAQGDILSTSDNLQIGKQYTFVLDMMKSAGPISLPKGLDSDSYIKSQLTYYMKNYGGVIRVTSSLLYRGYTVTVTPTTSYTGGDWEAAFRYSFEQLGYTDIVASSIFEGLPVSSTILGSIGTDIGGAIGSVTKPMTSLVWAVAAAGLIGLFVYGKYIQGGKN